MNHKGGSAMTVKQWYAVRTLAVLVSCLSASLLPLGTGAARAADVSALIAEENGNLDKLDVTTGAVSVIKNNGTVYEGLAYNANESVLYGTISTAFLSPTSLVTINPTTGVSTLVGSNGNGVALTTITNLSNGQLFGVDSNDNLYQINPNTGAATLIGPTGLSSLTSSFFANSLASNGTTLDYTLALTGDSSLYTLNTTTGAATLVGSTGVAGIVGSAFAGPTFASGQLYGFLTTGQTDVIDLATGAATSLNSNGLTDIFGGVGVVTSAAVPVVPLPPAAWPATALLGGLVCIGAIKKKLRTA
jgi:hypothetical protein